MRSTTHMRLEDCAAVSSGLIRVNVMTKRGMQSILARPVPVAPHLTNATFVVHTGIGADLGWSVTDADSGCCVGASLFSEEDAIAKAAANLAPRTDDDMARARAKARTRFLAAMEG